MRKVEDNINIIHNMETRIYMRNIHESRRRLSSSASGNGDSVCACSQNCYSVKAESIRVNGACYFDTVLLCTPPYPTYLFDSRMTKSEIRMFKCKEQSNWCNSTTQWRSGTTVQESNLACRVMVWRVRLG